MIATGTAIALGATALAAAAIGSTAIAASANKGSTPDAPTLPTVPGIQETADEQRRKLNQQRASQTETIITGPLGVKEDANVKKNILGA